MRKFCPHVLVAGLLTLGCGSDQGADAGLPTSLVGTWVAQPACAPPCAFTLTMEADPSLQIDAVSQLGVSVNIAVTRGGAFTLAFTGGSGAQSGTVRAEGDLLIVRDGTGTTDTIDWRIDADLLYLDFRRRFTVLDFTQDGVPDAAIAAGVFQRN